VTDDRPPGSGRRPPAEPDAVAGRKAEQAASVEPQAPPATFEIARGAFDNAESVEVAPEAFEPPVPTSGDIQPVPTSDAPSGDMRPLDFSLQPPGAPTPLDVAQAGEYIATPVPPAPAAPGVAPPTPDESILPAAYDEAALRDAVGAAPPRPKRRKTAPLDDDGLARSSNRKTIVIAGLAIVLGLGIAALVFLGRANAQRYVIACTTDHVSAEQGRGFPPWGTKPLVGAEWKAIALPANAECTPRETDDRSELEGWYLDLLVDRASATLTSKNLLDPVPAGKANPLDVAAEQLEQALLLSRAPEHRDQRKEVERLLGDVQYWRASLRLRDAAAGLAEAARQFDAAAAQRPRHVTDAAAWATFLRKLVDDLHAGPNGAPTTPAAAGPMPAPGDRPSAPMGTALPVEPAPNANEPPPPAPDAGLPTGGVLL
jgi:hypothetical protein